MKNSTTKKLASGLIFAILLATIGAVLATADTGDDADETEDWHMPFGERSRFGKEGFYSDLTMEQQEEIDELITSLNEEGTTPEEIHEAVFKLLDSWSLIDEKLDTAIARTEEQLEILYRKAELRDEEYSWEEIEDILTEEYDLDSLMTQPHGMRGIGRRMGRFGGGELNSPDYEITEDLAI